MEVLDLKGFSKLKKIDFGTEPKLRALTLKNLPELSIIQSNGDENAFCPFQKKESKSSKILSSPMFKNFHNLKKLNITDYEIVYLEISDSETEEDEINNLEG